MTIMAKDINHIAHAEEKSSPPSPNTFMPSGVNRWKNIAPEMIPNDINAPMGIKYLREVNSPSNITIEAKSSEEPTT